MISETATSRKMGMSRVDCTVRASVKYEQGEGTGRTRPIGQFQKPNPTLRASISSQGSPDCKGFRVSRLLLGWESTCEVKGFSGRSLASSPSQVVPQA